MTSPKTRNTDHLKTWTRWDSNRCYSLQMTSPKTRNTDHLNTRTRWDSHRCYRRLDRRGAKNYHKKTRTRPVEDPRPEHLSVEDPRPVHEPEVGPLLVHEQEAVPRPVQVPVKGQRPDQEPDRRQVSGLRYLSPLDIPELPESKPETRKVKGKNTF